MDTLTKAKLKRLVQSSDWDVIYAFQAFMSEKWNAEPLVGDTEYDTLRNAISRESKVQGLKNFLDNIENIALNND